MKICELEVVTLYGYILDKLIIDFTGEELFILVFLGFTLALAFYHIYLIIIELLSNILDFIFSKIDIVAKRK